MGIVEKVKDKIVPEKKLAINPEQQVSYPEATTQLYNKRYQVVNAPPPAMPTRREKLQAVGSRIISRAREHKYEKAGREAPTVGKNRSSAWKSALFERPMTKPSKQTIRYRNIPVPQAIPEPTARMALHNEIQQGRVTPSRAAMMEAQARVSPSRQIQLTQPMESSARRAMNDAQMRNAGSSLRSGMLQNIDVGASRRNLFSDRTQPGMLRSQLANFNERNRRRELLRNMPAKKRSIID